MQIDTGTHLTPSRLGVVLRARATCDPAGFAPELRTAAVERGLVLVRDLTLDAEAFRALTREVGRPIGHEFWEGQADMLRLDASPDDGRVATGRGPLPLHVDNLWIGEPTDLILLYAAEVSDAPGSGETVVVDQLAAWANMPAHLRRVLEEQQIEHRVDQCGPTPGLPEGWFAVSAIRDRGAMRSLYLALPFPPETPAPGWRVRVAGFRRQESEHFFRELDAHFRRQEFTYQHRWTTGDLLVINNQRTLHGRSSLDPTQVRLLYRGQVTLPMAD
jgi:alpha-ketoglutarate-dependent taurine dioxygenase